MKILNITQHQIHFVEAEETNRCDYVRFPRGGWYIWIGETLEPVSSLWKQKLETAFQQKVPPEPEPLDDLCSRMLHHAAFGGESGSTLQMTGSQIREALAPFFSAETIQRCVDRSTGIAKG